MAKFFTRVVSSSAFLAMVATVGCSTTNENKESSAMAMKSAPTTQARSGGATSKALGDKNLPGDRAQSSLDALRRGEPAATGAIKDIFFDFDQYNLDNDDRATLRDSAAWLKKNPSARVQIEGHCDERGTNEYNLALGAKRAQAAKDYLVSLGVAEQRMSTISYGEELPVCRDAGENCWQKNRRDRFVTSGGAKGTL